MKIIFLTRDDSNNRFHHIQIEAWSITYYAKFHRFKQIEKVILFKSKDMEHTSYGSIEMKVAKDGGVVSGAKSEKTFFDEKTSPGVTGGFSIITKEEYTAIRNNMVDLWGNIHIDFQPIKN